MDRTNDYSKSPQQNTNVANPNPEIYRGDRTPSSPGKPELWDSPSFEEFDLCMEVTAYVNQWQ